MAHPADLAQVGEEGFPIIDQFWGRQQRPRTPPPRVAESLLFHPSHCQNHPYIYHFTESPLITERLQYARVLPHETVHRQTQHQYSYLAIGSPEFSHYRGRPVERAAPVEGGSGAMDCNKAAILYRGKATVEYYGGF